jgi:hypothetical protein
MTDRSPGAGRRPPLESDWQAAFDDIERRSRQRPLEPVALERGEARQAAWA